MSNLYSRRLVRAGQRYKLTIVRPTMFDLECWEGQGKSRFFFSFLLSLIPLVKISFSHQALVSFAAVHFKIFIAVSVTKSCMVKITMRPELISGCTLFGDVSPCRVTLRYSGTLVDDL